MNTSSHTPTPSLHSIESRFFENIRDQIVGFATFHFSDRSAIRFVDNQFYLTLTLLSETGEICRIIISGNQELISRGLMGGVHPFYNHGSDQNIETFKIGKACFTAGMRVTIIAEQGKIIPYSSEFFESVQKRVGVRNPFNGVRINPDGEIIS